MLTGTAASSVACLRCGACAWHRNGTYPRHLVVLSRLRVQCWQCKVCRGRDDALLDGVSSRRRPQSFRELVTGLYVYSVSFRGLFRKLSLPIGGERLDLRLSGPDLDGGGWFQRLAQRGARGGRPTTTPSAARPCGTWAENDSCVSCPSPLKNGTIVNGDQCLTNNTVSVFKVKLLKVRIATPPAATRVSASTNRLEGWFGYFKPRARLTRGLKTEADPLNFVRLMAQAMA